VKLQRNGCDFIFLDRIHRIDGIFFAFGEMSSAEGRSILMIMLILSNCLSKIRIHSISFLIKLTTFQTSGLHETSLKFLFRLDRPFFGSAAGLNTEPVNG